MIQRIVFLGLSLTIAVSGAIPASVALINERLRALDARMEEISTAPVLQSRDAAMVEEYFLYMIQQNPSIQVMTRIDPDGTVLNLVNGNVAGRRTVSVADERWFSLLCKTKQPYTGTARDKRGRVLLFRALPIIESLGSTDRLIGIFSVKIDVEKYLSTLQINETDPVLVHCRGSTLFRRNWTGTTNHPESSLEHSCSNGLAVRYENPEYQSRVQSLSGETDTAHSSAVTMQNPENRQVSKTAAGSKEKKNSAVSEAPVSPDAGSSRTPVPALPGGSRSIITGIIALIAAVIIGVVSTALVRRSRLRKRRDHDFYKPRRTEPFEAVLLEDELSALSGDPSIMETNTHEECSSVERETRELPALQELIAESSKKLHGHEYTADPCVRNRLVQKIQDDLCDWVGSEFRHLSHRLALVSETIRECENNDGRSDELRELRHEIGNIMNEIGKLEKRLPREMVTSENSS